MLGTFHPTSENMKNEKDNEKRNESIVKRKTEIFFQEKKRVHLKLFDGTFYNGFLFEINSDNLIIHDRIIGMKKLFFFEIKRVEEYGVLK